jgi:hypothetical protein
MASAGASLVTSYGVLQSAGASLTTSYAVENDSGLTPVGVSLTTSYGVLNAAGASLTTSYEVEGSDDVSTDLIVEDGTGKADAESYASVAAADLYHSLRRNAVWATYGVAVKEAALRKATEWLDSEFSGLWQGWRSHATQALAWPRSGVVIDGVAVAYNALPAALTRATCELSLRAAIGPLTIDVGAQVTSKTVGPISVTYAHGARQQTKYAGVENLVSPLLKSGRGTVRLVRA